MRSRYPLVSRVTIPVVGALFGRKERTAERTDPIVLISPRVVRNELEARELTEEIRSRMCGLQELDEFGILDASGVSEEE